LVLRRCGGGPPGLCRLRWMRLMRRLLVFLMRRRRRMRFFLLLILLRCE
jgi:hypothetical protein